MPIRPMKPCNFADWKERYPVLVQPKIDGVRCIVDDAVAYSASGKPLPNSFIQAMAQRYQTELDGVDGEWIINSSFQSTVGAVMHKKATAEDVQNLEFHMFDMAKAPPDIPFRIRQRVLRLRHHQLQIDGDFHRVFQHVGTSQATRREELDAMIEATSDMPPWWDGLILRDPEGVYKRGRSTGKEGYLVKYKPFKEATATVIGVEELMRNQNEPEENAFGLVKRSTAQAEKVGAEMLGAFICRMEFDGTSVEFKVGTGLTAAQRRRYWYLFLRQAPGSRTSPIGKTIRFKYLPIGSKDKPRHPVFLRFDV